MLPGNAWPAAGSGSCVVMGRPMLRGVGSEHPSRANEPRKSPGRRSPRRCVSGDNTGACNRPDAQVRPGSKSGAQVHGFLRNVGVETTVIGHIAARQQADIPTLRVNSRHNDGGLSETVTNWSCPKSSLMNAPLAILPSLDKAAELLLPAVTYFQVVFTLPDKLSSFILGNRAPLYRALMHAAWESLRESIESELGTQAAGLMVLHTWNQRLEHHPHVHVLVPGSGPSLDGQRGSPAG